jgi:hypothetical protein
MLVPFKPLPGSNNNNNNRCNEINLDFDSIEFKEVLHKIIGSGSGIQKCFVTLKIVILLSRPKINHKNMMLMLNITIINVGVYQKILI